MSEYDRFDATCHETFARADLPSPGDAFESGHALDWAAKIEAAEMEGDEARVAARAEEAAIARQDEDYRACRIMVDFKIEGPGVDCSDYASELEPADWSFDEDVEVNAGLVEKILPRAAAAMDVWLNHFAAMGLIRADDLFSHSIGNPTTGGATPTFYLVHEPTEPGDDPIVLAEIPSFVIDIPELPSATITVLTNTHPVNATLLFDAAKQCDFSTGRWGGDATIELKPAADESRGAWLARVAFSTNRITETVERWDGSGRNPVVFQAYGDHTERASRDAEIDWLVNGRIPRGCFTLLSGSSSVGKSSMVQSWMAALGCLEDDRPRSVLGGEVAGRFVCALISGEDTNGIIEYRATLHRKLWGRSRYIPFTDPGKGLSYYLDQLWLMPVLDLIAVDPVRSFFDGDETSAIAVEKFCQPLLEIARAKNCAVLLVHHVTKGGGEPASIAELKLRTRGSSAFIDNARMHIGAVKRRDGTIEVGPVKYNFPAEQVWLPMSKGIRYWPDPETFTLQPVTAEAAGTAQDLAPEIRVLAAVTRCNRAGAVVRKSGKSGVYECKHPEAAGLSRNVILDAIAVLIRAGELADGEAGLIAKEWRPSASDV